MKSNAQKAKVLKDKVRLLAGVDSEQRKKLALFEAGLAELNSAMDRIVGEAAVQYGEKIYDDQDPQLLIGYRLELDKEAMRHVQSTGEIRCAVDDERGVFVIGLTLAEPVREEIISGDETTPADGGQADTGCPGGALEDVSGEPEG